jgi:hypothetical protein
MMVANSAYAGFQWNDRALDSRMASASEQLAILRQTPRTIDPGRYRVYLSPVAMYEHQHRVWGGFGLKSHRTKQTSCSAWSRGRQAPPDGEPDREHCGIIAPDFQGEDSSSQARLPSRRDASTVLGRCARQGDSVERRFRRKPESIDMAREPSRGRRRFHNWAPAST